MMTMSSHNEQQTYRVEGLSCANCAKTFENNVKNLDGVKDADVNFAASKINIAGNTTIEAIEKAGSFENIKVVTNDTANEKKEPFWIRNDKLILATLFILLGFGATYTFGNGHYLSTLLFALAILTGGLSLFKTGLINLVHLQFDMKTLMTIAVLGAAIIGEWREAAVVVILFAISEALESYSMDKARASIRSLMNLSPKSATIRRDGIEQTIDVRDIVIGDTMLIKPGERIAMDGHVVSGVSTIDESPITGESIPVEKEINAPIFAGTINQDGYLEVEVTKKADDTSLAKIIHLVEEAQAERAPSQAFVDRFAAYYTPIIIVIALLVAIIPPLFGAAWSTWIYQGLAVLVVGCPCALVISTPVAIVTAIGRAARNGVLIKGGIHLEQIGFIQSIAFDKTGTLTKGKPEVTDVKVYTDKPEQAFQYLKALESKSQHPLAKAITNYINEQQIDASSVHVDQFLTVQGKGIQGDIDGQRVYVGSPSLFNTISTSIEKQLNAYYAQGKTVMLCGTDKEIYLLVALRDEPKTESKSVLTQLHELGIKHSVMLTGDHPQTANTLGSEMGVSDVHAKLLPEQKLQLIKEYQQKHETIAMVGDGINDTPALAASNVGIAMGTAGTDSALETADIALMGDDLQKLPFTVKLSRKALAIIKQNITFAIGIKVLALLLVIPGWLTLWIAIFADMGATLLVTLNALRLVKVK
ncbi:heavy metal translocating P-type ATPase [Oceanobacillus halotolerans]|uniref:heavy metal translocating P-type ATPase n=1 Tax=Oceanobacillus halotolerans TaxID=2663380 RepID=UPI0013DA585D